MIRTVKGPFTAGVYGLARMIAESTAFQRHTKTSDWKDAERFIELWGYKDYSLDALAACIARSERAGATIWPGDRLSLVPYAGGERQWANWGGNLFLGLADVDRHTADGADQGCEGFMEWIDDVLQDLRKQSNCDDRLKLGDINLIPNGWGHSPLTENAAYWHIRLIVDWSA